MVLTNVEIFTRKYTVRTILENGVQFELDAKSVEDLTEYLQIVLPYYTTMPEGELNFTELLQIANQWQMENPDQKLSEPTTKLPYDVDIRASSMLQEISKVTGVSQAQLIRNMVDEAYNEVVKEK